MQTVGGVIPPSLSVSFTHQNLSSSEFTKMNVQTQRCLNNESAAVESLESLLQSLRA